MIIKNDFHIHSHCSCDSACAQIADILKEGRAAGIDHIGISDHLHTGFNLPDIEIARKEFLEIGKVPHFHFGLEITCATAWECEKIAKRDFASCFTYNLNGIPFQTMTPIDGIMYGGPANGPLQIDISKEDIERLGIEYIIGGVHKPNYTEQEPKTMIDDFFNQNCFMLKHELIDIIAHPWDGLHFWGSWFIVTRNPADKKEEIFYQIPQEYWDEIGKLAVENNKLIEINATRAGIKDEKIYNYYISKLAEWREKGVKFTYGSDLHAAHYDGARRERTEDVLSQYGFTENDFAMPPRLK